MRLHQLVLSEIIRYMMDGWKLVHLRKPEGKFRLVDPSGKIHSVGKRSGVKAVMMTESLGLSVRRISDHVYEYEMTDVDLGKVYHSDRLAQEMIQYPSGYAPSGKYTGVIIRWEDKWAVVVTGADQSMTLYYTFKKDAQHDMSVANIKLL